MDTDGHRSEREIICVNLCLSVVERMDFSQQEPFPATGCLKKPYWATTKGRLDRMGRTSAKTPKRLMVWRRPQLRSHPFIPLRSGPNVSPPPSRLGGSISSLLLGALGVLAVHLPLSPLASLATWRFTSLTPPWRSWRLGGSPPSLPLAVLGDLAVHLPHSPLAPLATWRFTSLSPPWRPWRLGGSISSLLHGVQVDLAVHLPLSPLVSLAVQFPCLHALP
jgi:hypothetical protein